MTPTRDSLVACLTAFLTITMGCESRDAARLAEANRNRQVREKLEPQAREAMKALRSRIDNMSPWEWFHDSREPEELDLVAERMAALSFYFGRMKQGNPPDASKVGILGPLRVRLRLVPVDGYGYRGPLRAKVDGQFFDVECAWERVVQPQGLAIWQCDVARTPANADYFSALARAKDATIRFKGSTKNLDWDVPSEQLECLRAVSAAWDLNSQLEKL